jgi:hypothetical protein
MARRRRARVQGREDKIFSHLRRHGSVAELNQFVRKTQELVENRGYRMVVGADGFFQVIPQGPLPHGFRLDVVRGHGVPPPPLHPFLGCDFDFGRPFLPFGCEDAFDAFGCHEDFGSQFLPYGCHPHGHYGCEHFVPYGCYPHYDCHYGCEDDF